MNETCVMCNGIIPEGRQICPNCENVIEKQAEKMQAEEADMQKDIEAVQQLIKIIAEVLTLIIEKAGEVLLQYQNKKVLHLALHHPKERVRKKNMHRIMRWITTPK